MEADSNMSFHHDPILASALNRHAISFQSNAINSTSGIIPQGNFVLVNGNSTPGMILAGNSSMINNNYGMTYPGNSVGGHLLDSVPGLKHDTGFAVEWSVEEQSKLEEGLVNYGSEPNIMKYIKIAAILGDKTVRDVALRCRWMMKENGKRRKQEHYVGGKMKDRKEMLAESSSKGNTPSVPPPNLAAYSLMMHHMDHNDRISHEVLVDCTTKHLLDENAQIFRQVASNLATFKLQDNINLLCRTRNNITVILNNMREMPGIMSHMRPLPVSIDEELANTILPNKSQAMMFGSPIGIHMKQEPRW